MIPRHLAPLFTAAALLCAIHASAQAPTVLTMGSQPIRTGVRRLGLNLSGQTFYDSGQMQRNLIARNPGFEAGEWQTILHCKTGYRDTCIDTNEWSNWPDGFADNARFEVLTGPAAGATGIVTHSLAAHKPEGVRLALSGASANGRDLHAGDYIVVRMPKPGHPEAGWWLQNKNGASVFAETHDLSPKTLGHQALRINATGPSATTQLRSFFDTLTGYSFVQLRGSFQVAFRAKPVSPGAKLHLTVERLDTTNGNEIFLSHDIVLKPGWNDYVLPFTAHESRKVWGPVDLTFDVAGAELLLDDVSLGAPASPQNPTPFRAEVLRTLQDLHPGILRYMDNGASFGTSIDNWIAPDLARLRSGASTNGVLQEDVAIGLQGFLQLCATVGAEPWITLPPGISTDEARNLIEFLGGPATSSYGKRRAAMGRTAPWADAFPTIHLELGNEQWNALSFVGAVIDSPQAYGQRTSAVFAAMRSAPTFRRDRFDLVIGTWAVNPWWTGEELKAADATTSGAPDSVAVAPYLFYDFKVPDPSKPIDREATFGAMFAQPEQLDSRPSGYIVQQADTARNAAHPAKLEVYEVNLGTLVGNAPQSAIDATVPSLGAGIAVADHMLLMLRDLGVNTQCVFALPEIRNGYVNNETIPLWGVVIDMGGATDRLRPTGLALEQINRAILPNLLPVAVSGANPTWNQPKSLIDKIELHDAHELQAFAFADGKDRSLILINLSREKELPISFAGPNTPTAGPGHPVTRSLLAAPDTTANNEKTEEVKLISSSITNTPPNFVEKLPPHSMTVLKWTTP